MSKRRTILAAVKSALEGISTASGYNYTVDSVRFGVRDPGRISAFPAIDFFTEDEDEIEYTPDGVAQSTLPVTVVGYLRGDASDDDLIIEDLLADITKAMHADHTLGVTGVADVRCTMRSTDPGLDSSDLSRVALARFDIIYLDDYGSL